MACVEPMYTAGFDAESEALCLRLQLEDLDHATSNAKGKEAEGHLSDAQLAQQLYLEELSQANELLSDRLMAESIGAAVRRDGPSISAELAQADLVARDHEYARNLSQGRACGYQQEKPAVASNSLEDELVEKLEALYMTPMDALEPNDLLEVEHAVAGSSTGPAPPVGKKRKISKTRRCTACREQCKFVDVARVPCGDEYCRDCLEQLLQLAARDESLYPPRCCKQPFELNSLRLFVPLEVIQEVESKEAEFTTPNRTYCSVSGCSRFIPMENVTNGVATCPDCRSQTCATCKGYAHEGDCPEDEGLRAALDLLGQEGWQRCPKCWTGVELREGCYHITCRCSHEFCYICGERWKTCGCEQWDQVRLRRRARLLVDRNAAPPRADFVQPVDLRPVGPGELLDGLRPFGDGYNEPLPILEPESVSQQVVRDIARDIRARRHDHQAEVAREAEIEAMMQNLEANHDCNHPRWKFVPGPHQCEECFHTLPQYIFECRQCRIQACNRCRKNRL